MFWTVIFCSLILYFLLYHFYLKRRNLPPGPLPFPFLGNLPKMLCADNIYDLVFEWCNRYGKTFTVWIGPKAYVVMCDYDQLKKANLKQFEAFARRERNFLIEFFFGGSHFCFSIEKVFVGAGGGEYGILLSDGPLHQEQRRFLLHVLRDLGFGRSLTEDRLLTEIRKMQNNIEQRLLISNICSLQLDIEVCVGNIINAFLFGYTFDTKDPKFHRLKHMLNNHYPLLFSKCGALMTYFPIVRFLPGFNKVFRQIKDGREKLLNFLKVEIDEHRENFDPNSKPHDYVDAYLKEMKKREKSGEKMGYFSDWQLFQMCFDMWPAGTENTVNTLQWALLYMILFPEVQDKIHVEIDTNVTTKDVTMADKCNLTFTIATIQEIQRHSNMLLLTPPRKTTRKIRLDDGHIIFPGTAVFHPISLLNANSEYFPNPDKFIPERFLNSDKTLKKSPYFIPFSFGRRSCPGESLAKMEIFLILANLLKKFKFSLAPGRPKPTLRRNWSISMTPDKYECYVEVRNQL